MIDTSPFGNEKTLDFFHLDVLYCFWGASPGKENHMEEKKNTSADQIRLVWPDGKTVILNPDGLYCEKNSHPLPNRNPSKAPLESTEGDVDRETEPPGMKWAKFLQYFALLAGAILHLYLMFVYWMADSTLLSSQVSADYSSGIRSIEILYGFACLAGAVFNVVAWYMLVHRKAATKSWTLVCYLVPAGSSLLYTMATSAALSATNFNAGTIIGLLVQGAFAIYNYNYFNNRSAIFKN